MTSAATPLVGEADVELHQVWFSAASVFGSSWLVISSIVPIGLITVALLGVAHLFYGRDPSATQLEKVGTVDHLVVHAQLRRAAASLGPDLAFMGDSSCLMGIHVPTLLDLLPGVSMESYCMIAYAGPAAYAHVLEEMVRRGAPPKRLVIALHPVSFQREPSWDGWLPFIHSGGQISTIPETFPATGLDFVRFRLLSLLYRPMPRAYGLYYGSAGAFSGDIRNNHGSAVDPGTGLSIHSVSALLAAAGSWSRLSATPQSYAMNPAFVDALDKLAAVLKGLDRTRIFVMISPIPGSWFGPEATGPRLDAAVTIAQRLGVPAQNVLETAPWLPDPYFSSVTHLNRWGRVLFTQSLAEQIRAHIPLGR